MALTRPIVLVYQQYASINIAPSSPDLNCVLVGPCFYIQDYPTDAADIGAGSFVKTGYTTPNAPCVAADGKSDGRPANSANFLVLDDPPNHIAGGVLDSASVDVVFDDAYIELTKGTDMTGNAGALLAGDYILASAAGAFETTIPHDATTGVPTYATRIVLTNTAGTGAVVKNITKVVSATHIWIDSVITTAPATPDELAIIGAANILYRVETILVDQHIDAAYYTVLGNEITIKTGASGILLTFNSLTYPVNFATMYVGYRELRTDLTDVHTLDALADVATTIGRNDERNPLGAAATLAFANTSTTVQVFGVSSDDLTGQTDAKDKMSARSDIYAIVPLQDNVSDADWVSIMSMWKLHVTAYAVATVSKFRMIIGSYGTLPTTKDAVPESLVGSTVLDPAGGALVDVFIDADSATEFLQAEIDSTHLLDITHKTGADPITQTVADGATIFDVGYGGAAALLGAMGEKRLRTAAAIAGGAGSNAGIDYAVRSPILLSEGATPILVLDDVTWTGAGVNVRITKPAATTPFTGVAVGDTVRMYNSTAHNIGFVVTAIDGTAAKAYIEISSKEVAAEVSSGSIHIEVYRPLAYAIDAVASAPVVLVNTLTAAGKFASVAPGDIAYVLDTNHAVPVGTNKGMWIVQSATANTIVLYTDAAHQLNALAAAAINVVAVFRPAASAGIHAVVTRKRLTRLTDLTASFIGNVTPGMMIEIPHPADVNPTHFDTPTTSWAVDTVISNEILDADLDPLEELAPKLFIAGYSLDCPYRISIALDKTAQVVELNTIPTSLLSNRVAMVWPNECEVTDLENALTGVTSRHHGQYLAVTVGAMIAGLPPHQGFTFIGVAGISQIYNSNFYFTDDQIDDLSEGGWYVFMQDSTTSAPYSAHEVMTDTSAYELGEMMYVKDFDYISLFYKGIMQNFLGRYNIIPETLATIQAAFDSGTQFLKFRVFPKIGAPLISAEITKLEQLAGEVDRVELYAEVNIPKVLNKIGLHLIA